MNARLLAEVIDNNADILDGYYAYANNNGKGQQRQQYNNVSDNGNDNGNGSNSKDKQKRMFTAFKYSNNKQSPLFEGREKELAKPIIQLFYGSKAQKQVEATLQTFLSLRTEKKEITLEPIILPMVADLVSQTHDNEVYVREIWDKIKEIIPQGLSDERKPNEYHTLEYCNNNTISNILEHTFGGRPKHRRDGNTFIFDSEELARVARA